MTQYLSTRQTLLNITIKALVKPLLIGATCFATACGAFAGTLFTEDFEGATANQAWNGYRGWHGQGWPISSNGPIIQALPNQDLYGSFTGFSETAFMQYDFEKAYSVEGAYRLSFDIRGSLHRSFQITLIDSQNARVGLQLGFNSTNIYQISGLFINSAESRTLYTEGGYGGASSAPENFTSGIFYPSFIDINGTSETVMIGEAALEAGKVRVVYNVGAGNSLSEYSIIFDLPESFRDLSGIRIQKAAGTSASWAINNIQLEQYNAIPEPSMAFFGVGGSLILICCRFFRMS